MTKEIKNGIVKGLHEHLGIDIVPADTASRKPDYPYISYKTITAIETARHSLIYETIPSTSEGFEDDVLAIRKVQEHFTLSISAFSMDEDEARDTAIKAADWFTFAGRFRLAAMNVAVISMGSVTDRTQLLVDDYERRYGFDARIRAARGIAQRMEGIEGHSLIGSVNPQE